MSKKVKSIYKRYGSDGEYTWYIDKRVKRVGRLCESTATADLEEAERYLLHRLHELRETAVYGARPRRRFREAAAKYLSDSAGTRRMELDTEALTQLDPFIGHLWLDQINSDSFNERLALRPQTSRIAIR